jgi:hypothetical protein
VVPARQLASGGLAGGHSDVLTIISSCAVDKDWQVQVKRRYSQAALGAFISCLLDRGLPVSKRGSKAAA